MIKGVNKQVLEINKTENSYFEKAIFFVKPEYCGMSEGKLREIASKEVSSAGVPPKSRKIKTDFTRRILPFALCFFAGAFVGFIVNIF